MVVKYRVNIGSGKTIPTFNTNGPINNILIDYDFLEMLLRNKFKVNIIDVIDEDDDNENNDSKIKKDRLVFNDGNPLDEITVRLMSDDDREAFPTGEFNLIYTITERVDKILSSKKSYIRKVKSSHDLMKYHEDLRVHVELEGKKFQFYNGIDNTKREYLNGKYTPGEKVPLEDIFFKMIDNADGTSHIYDNNKPKMISLSYKNESKVNGKLIGMNKGNSRDVGTYSYDSKNVLVNLYSIVHRLLNYNRRNILDMIVDYSDTVSDEVRNRIRDEIVDKDAIQIPTFEEFHFDELPEKLIDKVFELKFVFTSKYIEDAEIIAPIRLELDKHHLFKSMKKDLIVTDGLFEYEADLIDLRHLVSDDPRLKGFDKDNSFLLGVPSHEVRYIAEEDAEDIEYHKRDYRLVSLSYGNKIIEDTYLGVDALDKYRCLSNPNWTRFTEAYHRSNGAMLGITKRLDNLVAGTTLPEEFLDHTSNTVSDFEFRIYDQSIKNYQDLPTIKIDFLLKSDGEFIPYLIITNPGSKVYNSISQFYNYSPFNIGRDKSFLLKNSEYEAISVSGKWKLKFGMDPIYNVNGVNEIFIGNKILTEYGKTSIVSNFYSASNNMTENNRHLVLNMALNPTISNVIVEPNV